MNDIWYSAVPGDEVAKNAAKRSLAREWEARFRTPSDDSEEVRSAELGLTASADVHDGSSGIWMGYRSERGMLSVSLSDGWVAVFARVRRRPVALISAERSVRQEKQGRMPVDFHPDSLALEVQVGLLCVPSPFGLSPMQREGSGRSGSGGCFS